MLREGAVAQQVTTKRSGVMAGLATALSDPNDILFFAVYSYRRRYRLLSGAVDGGVGAYRPERAFA